MSELGIIAVIFLSGWMILSGFGMRNWGIIPLGFLTGTFLVLVVGSALVVTGLPTYPWVILLAGLLVSGGILLAKLRSGSRLHLGFLAVGFAVLVPLVAAFRGANLVSYHIDSFRYLVGSGLLARDSFEFATLNILEKRLLSAPVVHSLADLNGESYLRSHSPLLTLALLAFLVWVLFRGRGLVSADRRILIVAGLAVLLIATNNRMIFNSFYINDHLVLGAAFLVACSASWILARGAQADASPLLAALILALPTLVVTRPEGFIAGALAMLPLILSSAVPRRTRLLVLVALSYSTLMWFGYVSIVRFNITGGFSLRSIGPALAGILGLTAAPVLLWSRIDNWHRRLLLGFESALWLVLAVLTVREPETLVQSLRATFQNVVLGAGSWGYSLVILALIALAALLLARDKALVHLRFPLTAFVPVFFLLAYLRDGAYRVGNGDSLNRMLMQMVPVAVLYIAAVVWSRIEEAAAEKAAPSAAHASGPGPL